MTDEQPKPEGRAVVRLDVDREALEALPEHIQLALMRATTDAAKTMTKRFRFYKRSRRQQFWRSFGRTYWYGFFPVYGAIWFGYNIVRTVVDNWRYLEVAWLITKAMWRLP